MQVGRYALAVSGRWFPDESVLPSKGKVEHRTLSDEMLSTKILCVS